jgi:hypothetical protein
MKCNLRCKLQDSRNKKQDTRNKKKVSRYKIDTFSFGVAHCPIENKKYRSATQECLKVATQMGT